MSASEVLVVGAGPSGLTIAIELARRGIPVRLVDRAPAANTETRALGMQARTLELFERHGITDDLLTNGLRAERFHVFSEGRRILRADFGDLPSVYPFLLMIPQHKVEAILAARLAGLGLTIERRTVLEDLNQSCGKVTVTLSHEGRDETADFDWVIGADGAHSTVRRLLGVGFLGSSFEETFAVADLRVDWPYPHEEFFAFLNRGRFAAFFPMLGGWHRVAIAQPITGSDPVARITTAQLQSSLTDVVSGRAAIEEVRQAGLFRINQRRAAHHRCGNVFLVGDAAHIHSVIGAQGMNTGIQDAMNLGWKLAEVVRGSAGPSLLDTYAVERVPVAERLVKGTRRITQLTLLRSRPGTFARRLVAPRLLGRPSIQTVLTRAISQIDVSYHDEKGSSPADRADVGDRAPDAAVARSGRDRARIHRLFHPSAFTLLSFGISADRVAAALDVHTERVRMITLALDDPSVGRYDVRQPTVILVRPDGYIAARGDLTAIRSHLDQLFPAGVAV